MAVFRHASWGGYGSEFLAMVKKKTRRTYDLKLKALLIFCNSLGSCSGGNLHDTQQTTWFSNAVARDFVLLQSWLRSVSVATKMQQS